ncbi:bifunctional 4-hydroxy-2-oxoglutarate aldolase/2-dehydro-3-deoxy-phosphogluconate aldolase [Amycolatopsis suaedae]|uniref:Bifunctional 4-hydroxy-2-oxoglutarate aldolase/2-dehydro-3-deoxy-phosphogluconate aldolase n=1 Tax=Amycolatopsis suaedae TaxID=2510978 RepID=A0A4Q7IWN5_9PSEU|nr:bifunctional 4-hydroxy-2-oxoglutarate aldolase/2-dehydro-3-deoxy-phosphogluconate aldolase [Amycolatopsis suaedae]RZQ59340.1 bifunctional 4-hydroxy-2-oxoglutarate aldolase/2-dehydro-3-deoxy-phosphogluconate aldolase [Amycolatopsis suaedae]
MTFLDELTTHRLVAILRADDTSRFTAVGRVLRDSGVRLLEAALTTPGAPEAITELVRELPDVIVGAGSVREPGDVDTAAEAGAAFLVTPTVNPAVLARAEELKLPVLAGAYTPTEIDQAWRLGATAVKLFPAAQAGGVDYVKAVRAPLPDVPLVPTGGVGPQDVRPYLDAGAVAVAVAGPLIGESLRSDQDDRLAIRAWAFVNETTR